MDQSLILNCRYCSVEMDSMVPEYGTVTYDEQTERHAEKPWYCSACGSHLSGEQTNLIKVLTEETT